MVKTKYPLSTFMKMREIARGATGKTHYLKNVITMGSYMLEDLAMP